MALPVNTLIKGLVVLGVIVIVLVAAWYLLPKLFHAITGDQLPPEMQEEYETNFENLVENIKDCKNTADTACVCDGFPNFPGTFKDKLYFVSQARDMEVRLEVGTTIFDSEKIEGVYITGILVEDTGLNFDYIKDKIDIYAEKWVDFDKNPPVFDRDGLGLVLGQGLKEPIVVDSRIYRDEYGVLYLLLANEKSLQVQSKLNGLRKCGA
jgi:hypothetical protein